MKKRRSYPKAMKLKVVLEWLETPGRMPAVAQDHGVTCGMISKWKKGSSLFHQLNQINSDGTRKEEQPPGTCPETTGLGRLSLFQRFDLKKHTMLTSKL
jgi:transposase-like protein